MRLRDEVAVITGSTKGIGRAMAVKFAAEGARVVVTGRTEHLGQEVVEEITAAGGQARFVRTDVTVEADVERAVAAAVDTYGGLTALVNNAAPIDLLLSGTEPLDGSIQALSTEGWNQILHATLTSAFWGCKYAVAAMASGNGGSIVNISSTGSIRGVAGMTGYSVAKAGIHALTRSVAVDGAGSGVRCNTIIVGTVPIPGRDDAVMSGPWADAARSVLLTRLGVPADIASLASFLVSHEAEFITGATIVADGGATSKMARPPLSDLTAAFKAAADSDATDATDAAGA